MKEDDFDELTSDSFRDYEVSSISGSEDEAEKEAAVIAPYLVEPAFTLPAYKGVPLSFRPWDHQLRQAIIVVQPKALVSVAPEQGFLHQRTPLDTLGVDLPETTCKFK